MNKTMRTALTAIGAWLGILLPALALVIATDTEVTDADVATYTGADAIEIQEGATLTFKDLSADATFQATLTGGGRFVVDSSAPTPAKRITLDGDATGFTGSFHVTNMVFTATKPSAVGSARFYYRFAVSKAVDKSYLRGPGTYTCPMDIHCSSTGGYGVFLDDGVVLNAPVAYRTGRVNGPGTIAGKITIDKTIYVANSLRIAGDVELSASAANASSILGDGSPYVIAGPLSNVPSLLVVKTTCSFDGANLLDSQQLMTLGGSSSKTGTYDLMGFDQCAGSFEYKQAPTTDADKAKNILTSTTEPATLSLVNQNKNMDFTGVINDHLSLCVAGTGVFTLSGVNNTTDGSLIASNGFLTVAAGASFANLSNLVVKGSGKITVNSETVNPGQVDVEFFDSGTLEVKDGMTLEVSHALIDGVYLDPDTYTGSSGPLAGRLTGTLKVNNGAPVVEGQTYTWVGGTADDAMNVGDNWVGGVAPSFNGPERLVFGTEEGGSARAVVVGDISVYAIEIDASQPFAIESANAAARIQLGVGGLLVTNRLDDLSTPNQVTVSCPIHLTALPQTWTVAAGTVFENAAPLSSDDLAAPLTISARGRVMFKADNSALLAPMEFTDIDSMDVQPFVYHRYGLGASNRFTTVNGAVPRIVRTEGMGNVQYVTNATPLRVSAATTQTGYFTRSNYADHYWQEGAVRVFGNENSSLYVYGNCHFSGGIVNEGTGQITLRVQLREMFVENSPILTSGILATDYDNTIHLNVAGNTWSTLGLLKSTLLCGAAGALDSTAAIRLGTNNQSFYAENMGTLDLGGFDQGCGRLYKQWNPWGTSKDWGKCYAMVTSAAPAQLEVKSAEDDSVPLKVEGAAGITFNGTGSLSFTNFLSSTVGTLNVAKGTVRFETGAGWTATTNVVVGAEGRIVVGAGTGAPAFGPASGASAANLAVASGGVIEIASGEQPTVKTLTLADGGSRVQQFPGVYGGVAAAGAVDYRVNWIEGAGTLRVLKPTGMILFVR